MSLIPLKFTPRVFIIGIALVTTTWFWYLGLIHSPIVNPPLPGKHSPASLSEVSGDSASAEESALARAYWQRYPDVGQDSYFGINGVMGIRGARAHYQQHGRLEGRVWGIQPNPAEKAP